MKVDPNNCAGRKHMQNQNMRTKINIGLGALALGVALVSAPALAQEVWQTYPQTISTPAFGPGYARIFATPETRPARRTRAARPVYNAADYASPSSPQGGRCEVWQTYPGTISTPAFGHYDSTCQD
jgi:hypothetical protein